MNVNESVVLLFKGLQLNVNHTFHLGFLFHHYQKQLQVQEICDCDQCYDCVSPDPHLQSVEKTGGQG